MEFRYFGIDPRLKRLFSAMGDLMRAFEYLLLRFGGDAQKALEYMKALQENGYIDKTVNLDDFKKLLEQARIIQRSKEGDYNLTGTGERFIRTSALEEIFTSLKKGEQGEHKVPFAGDGGDRLPEVRSFEYGDEISNLDLGGSVFNSMIRTRSLDLELQERDLQVYETEHNTNCATVLLIDISHSMIIYGEDRITPAKRVALALSELIRTKYTKDSLNIIAFGDNAYEIQQKDITYLQAGPYHTNTREALRMARMILMRKKQPNRQIFMVTDGKPSCVYDEGQLYVNPFGLDPKIVNMTLQEASLCRRHGIVVTTFMLARDPYLVEFVNKLTALNKGRAYFTSTDSIDKYVFIDYIRNRRKHLK